LPVSFPFFSGSNNTPPFLTGRRAYFYFCVTSYCFRTHDFSSQDSSKSLPLAGRMTYFQCGVPLVSFCPMIFLPFFNSLDFEKFERNFFFGFFNEELTGPLWFPGVNRSPLCPSYLALPPLITIEIDTPARRYYLPSCGIPFALCPLPPLPTTRSTFFYRDSR